MKTAERNDVDITKLFRYEKEVEIEDKITDQKAKFYQRLVGDADVNRARVFGLRASHKLRKELREPGSDMREAFISELPEFKSRDVLIQSIILLMSGEIQLDALNNTKVPEPRPPKADAPLEEMEEFQAKVDAYEEKYRKELDKQTKKVQKREEKRLQKMTDDELYDQYEALIIDRLCTDEMASKYYEMCVHLGTYSDSQYKKRAFSSYEEFENASPYLKDRLVEEYRRLEIGMDELKKLPEATEL